MRDALSEPLREETASPSSLLLLSFEERVLGKRARARCSAAAFERRSSRRGRVGGCRRRVGLAQAQVGRLRVSVRRSGGGKGRRSGSRRSRVGLERRGSLAQVGRRRAVRQLHRHACSRQLQSLQWGEREGTLSRRSDSPSFFPGAPAEAHVITTSRTHSKVPHSGILSEPVWPQQRRSEAPRVQSLRDPTADHAHPERDVRPPDPHRLAVVACRALAWVHVRDGRDDRPVFFCEVSLVQLSLKGLMMGGGENPRGDSPVGQETGRVHGREDKDDVKEAVVVPRAGPLVVVDRAAGNSRVVVCVGIVLRLKLRQRRRW
jgi:hypothetical protein